VVVYEWSCSPSGFGATPIGYNILSPFSASTEITFTQNGNYFVYCKFTNSDGCTYIDSSNAISVNIGSQASFNINQSFCLNDSGYINNDSKLAPTGYKWYSDGTISFLPTDTSRNPVIVFSQKGIHPVSLISISVDGCLDTTTKSIIITKPVADFETMDTINICSPALVTFHSKSSPDAIFFTWDFGDGSAPIISTDTTISHVFAIKNGQSDFNIKLSVENIYGCKDVMIKNNYVRITGPVPYFKMSNTKGCEPLYVHLEDSSRNVYKFSFNYGFGSPDSTLIGDKVYTLSSPNVLYSVYKPYLYVVDITGSCFQIYQPDDSIVVYSRPKANFYVNDNDDCAPFAVKFLDSSIAATSWKWDFNNDGIIDDTAQSPVHTYNTPGKYSVKLIVTNQFGCTDTLIKTNYIEVFQLPVAKFTVSTTAICPHTAVGFTNQSTAPSPLIRYHWDFGVPGTLADTSDLADPAQFVYDITGVYTVKLWIIDSTSCVDSLILSNKITVFDSLPPSQPEPYYVTVENDKDIKIVWNKNTAADFDMYNLYRATDGYTFYPFYKTAVVTDTSYIYSTGINVKTQPYTFNMDAVDKCGYRTALSGTHQTIYLNATTYTQNSNLLLWTGYKGWPAGSYVYKLYKSPGYAGPYKLLTQLTDQDTTFIDTKLCDSTYYYYVEAVQATTNFVSKSNIEFNHPPYFVPKSATELIRASVINNSDVLVQWDTSGAMNVNRKIYLVDKMDPNGVFRNIGNSLTNTFIDNNVDVQDKSYTYRVRMQDYCGNVMQASNAGRTINLQASNVDYTVNLAWSSYGDWSNNIKYYLLEYFDPTTANWIEIARNAITDTFYTDTKLRNTDRTYCYRVKAVEDIQLIPDTSLSNEACVDLKPNITIPNAFSPNGDGLNDKFMAQGIFIQNLTGNIATDYQLRVYDRWGQVLYETHDLNDGWDGTYKGKLAEIGVYVYDMTALGNNKKRYNYKGTFNLLR
jgi:gliding motility-associated-like protein